MLQFSAFDLLFRWYDLLIMGSYKVGGLSSAIIPGVLVVSLIILLMVKRKKIDRTITQEGSFQPQPVYPETLPQPGSESQTIKSGALSWIIYLIWGLISLSPVVTIVGLIACNSSGCGSDTPGINTAIVIVLAAIWILIFANFILFCKKILNFPYPPLLIYIIWILIFVGGYFASSYQAQSFEQKSQQTLGDIKKEEITEINSPYISSNNGKTEYNDGEIYFDLPSAFVAIKSRPAVPSYGDENVIGFTDKVQKIRIVWKNQSKCKNDYAGECTRATKNTLKEEKNTNNVSMRFYELSNTGGVLDTYLLISLTPNRFDVNNYLFVDYDSPYEQGDYEVSKQSAVDAIEQIKKSFKLLK